MVRCGGRRNDLPAVAVMLACSSDVVDATLM